VKQISLAMNMYAQDADETYPPGRYFFGGDAWTWDYYIQPYAQKSGSAAYGQGKNAYLECPSDSIERTPFGGNPTSPRSYAIPMSAIADSDEAWKAERYEGSNYITEGRPLAEFSAPASTILIAEAPLRQNRIGNNTDFRVASPDAQSLHIASRVPHHSTGWNYGFADGHAKWHKPLQTVASQGITYPSSFRNANGYNCLGTMARPCGMWTLSDND
jgi:prepilin-type processing-associated H-X9-DG protein